ncbi:MAG: 4a-hydroxytetrahydrobiopterin dehydratase [Rhodocyclaceae bacterium]
MRPQKMSDETAQEALLALNSALPAPWQITDGKLCKHFRFADFNAAFAFMTRVAMAAEMMDHHPDWRNSYATVDIELMTHDAGGLTTLDFALAQCIEAALI